MKNEETNNELTTLIIVNQQINAHFIKSFLEEAGMRVFLQNELSAQLYGGNTVGGIRIQVPNTEAEKALDLLKEAGYVE